MIAVPGIPRELEHAHDRTHVNVIGAGRVGSAVSARLSSGALWARSDPDSCCSASPDRAIAEAAAYVAPGPWVGHSERRDAARRARPARRAASASIRCRRSRPRRGAEQLDGAWAAVTAETDEARAGRPAGGDTRAAARSRCSRTRSGPPTTRRRDRVELPRHAPSGGGLAARGRGCATRGARSVDAPDDRERLRAHRPDPARRLGDGRTAPARRSGPNGPSSRPSTERSPTPRWPSHEGLPDDRRRAGALSSHAAAARSASCRRWARCTRRPPSLLAAAREECSTVVMSLFVNPAQFADAVRPGHLSAGRGARPGRRRREPASTSSSLPPSRRCTRPGSRHGST